ARLHHRDRAQPAVVLEGPGVVGAAEKLARVAVPVAAHHVAAVGPAVVEHADPAFRAAHHAHRRAAGLPRVVVPRLPPLGLVPGAQALPVMAAASQGIFERHGRKVEVLLTVTSQEQRDGLAAGDFQIAQAAVDNAVAMVELARHDVVIVTGGDSSMNELFVQPDIGSYADLKGHTLLVDAPNTAYALQVKKILLIK